MSDNLPLFSAPTTATATAAATRPRRTTSPAAASQPQDPGLNTHGEPRRRANPGDELTVDPNDRRRRARAALLDLRRDVVRRSNNGW